LAEDYAARLHRGRGCSHCHQVKEYRRELLQAEGRWHRDDVWVYPLPENIGLMLEVDRGDRVRAVTPDSPAARVGVRAGDRLRSVNGLPVASLADVQYALHRAPTKGQVPIRWQHEGQTRIAELTLAEGWRKTNLTWRPSMLDLLPSLSLYGDDLTAAEKKALGLSAKRLAFRQDKIVHSSMRAVGVHGGDIILGIDNQPLEMTVAQFLAHVRKNYLVGDRITLNVLRAGKRLDLPVKLR
jgi:serine protease Do